MAGPDLPTLRGHMYCLQAQNTACLFAGPAVSSAREVMIVVQLSSRQ